MSLFRRYRWFALAGGSNAGVRRSVVDCARAVPVLTAMADVAYLVLTLGAARRHAGQCMVGPDENRRFWALMGLGCVALGLQSSGLGILRGLSAHTIFPDPSFMDFILVFPPGSDDRCRWVGVHIGVRASRNSESALLDFLMLLVWWVFLYAFIVFPRQYVVAECGGLRQDLQPTLSGRKRRAGVSAGHRCLDKLLPDGRWFT